MGWLPRMMARLFGAVPAEEGIGIGLHAPGYWVLSRSGGFDLYRFLDRLSGYLPEGAVVYLEGTSMAPDVRCYLDARPEQSPTQVMSGTYWPKPERHHMPATTENLTGLVEVARRHAEPEVCDHLVAYSGQDALLEWWDVPDGAILLSPDVPEDLVKRICGEMDCAYERARRDD